MRHRLKAPAALLIIDMFNTLDFPEGKSLLRQARPVAHQIARLKARAKRAQLPVIYVNDNFEQWQTNAPEVFHRCLNGAGSVLAEALTPVEDDYFVLKPKHSAFYSTTLDILLLQLKVETVILTGIAGNICVLFTANDAHMRGYNVWVPEDCMASNTRRDHRFAVHQLKNVLNIQVQPSAKVNLSKLK